MKLTRIVLIGTLIVAMLGLSGCNWLKSKLQGKVDEVNKGISDTTKELGGGTSGETTTPPADSTSATK